jgi:hypothetical protein
VFLAVAFGLAAAISVLVTLISVVLHRVVRSRESSPLGPLSSTQAIPFGGAGPLPGPSTGRSFLAVSRPYAISFILGLFGNVLCILAAKNGWFGL